MGFTSRGKPRLKKRIGNPDGWKREITKKLRNNGEMYISFGKVREAKRLQPPCDSMCRLKCTERITEHQRQEIFQQFWKLGDVNAQWAFIAQTTERIKPKYRRAKEESSRGLNIAYNFFIDGERLRVCKTFYLNTVDVSQRRVRTAVKKYIPEKDEIETDRRGKHNGHFRCVQNDSDE